MSGNDSGPTTYDELFKKFAEVAGEKDVMSDETSESLQRILDGEGTKQDQEQVIDSLEDWIENLFEDDSTK